MPRGIDEIVVGRNVMIARNIVIVAFLIALFVGFSTPGVTGDPHDEAKQRVLLHTT
jgi:hypothetical protein